MPKIFRAIGAMTGTSMDGVDLAWLETDGRQTLKFGPSASYPFSDDDRVLLRKAVAAARFLGKRDERPGALAEAEELITTRHVEAITAFLRDNEIEAAAVDLIGFHGQTVLHRPDFGLTVQIGSGEKLARRIGIDVAYDMRAADMAAGGQGAPLVPVFHRALAEASGAALPMLFVNIGGVANMTYVAPHCDPIACDAGPGNALLDDLMLSRNGAGDGPGRRLRPVGRSRRRRRSRASWIIPISRKSRRNPWTATPFRRARSRRWRPPTPRRRSSPSPRAPFWRTCGSCRRRRGWSSSAAAARAIRR